MASFFAQDVFSHFSTRPSFFSASLHTVTKERAHVRSSAGLAAAQNVDLLVREGEALERIHLPRNARRGAVNQNAVLMQDVDNDRELAVVVPVVDEHCAADLNESGETLRVDAARRFTISFVFYLIITI